MTGTSESKKKELRTSVVEYEDFIAYDYIPSAAFYVKTALQIIMLHSSKREECQEWVDLNYPPKGKYKVIATKNQVTKSKLESGGLSCTGTATRKGQKTY
jgi:hypothetical protein